MKKILLRTLVLVFSISGFPLVAADNPADQPAEFARCVPAGATVIKLSGDMGFLEGPVWLKATRTLVFSDIPNNELKQWSAAGGVTTFRKPSHNANGNITDLMGRLLTCEHTGRRVSLQEKDGTVKTVVDSFEGKKLNSPNDVVVRSDGTLWFTDPEYGLTTNPTTKQKEDKQQAGNFVYRHDPKTGKTTAVVKGFVQPNGLAFSPDEKNSTSPTPVPRATSVPSTSPPMARLAAAPFSAPSTGVAPTASASITTVACGPVPAMASRFSLPMAPASGKFSCPKRPPTCASVETTGRRSSSPRANRSTR